MNYIFFLERNKNNVSDRTHKNIYEYRVLSVLKVQSLWLEVCEDRGRFPSTLLSTYQTTFVFLGPRAGSELDFKIRQEMHVTRFPE